jgi:hypothetical protein
LKTGLALWDQEDSSHEVYPRKASARLKSL